MDAESVVSGVDLVIGNVSAKCFGTVHFNVLPGTCFGTVPFTWEEVL